MAVISQENPVASMIEVIPVKPENHQKLLNILIDLTENVVKNVPGFVSVSFHKSIDRTKVAIYAQWKNFDYWNAMVENPKVQSYFQQIKEIQESADNHAIYDLVYTIDAK